MRRVFAAACLLAALTGGAGALIAHAKELTLDVDDLHAAGFSATGIRAKLSGPGLRALDLDVRELRVAGRAWRKVKATCAESSVGGGRIACARGMLHLGAAIPMSFSYTTGAGDLSLELAPARDEIYRVSGRVTGSQRALEIRIDKGRLDRLAPLLPAGSPKITSGRASGTARLDGAAISAKLEIDGAAFADASGLHAGEKIGATVEATAAETPAGWRWNVRGAWRSGEVFWQPFFLAGKGHRLEAQGATARGVTEITSGRLDMQGVGAIAFSGRWDHAKGALAAYDASSPRVRVGGLYEDLLKPLVQGTALSDLRAEGEAGFSVRGDAALAAVQLDFTNVSFEDRQRRFAVFGLNGRVPWRRDEQTTGEISTKGAEFLKVPLGGTKASLRLRAMRVDVASLRVPIFDGAVELRDFALGMARDGWRWRFSGKVAPISMERLTGAFGLPTMYGAIGGEIPELRYRRGTLSMDGALAMRAFDGLITASRIELIEPFGRAPRLHADLEVKNMDLELLTRAFDFGTITGRLDAHVAGLELVNWSPVRFDARLASSPGSYPRKISQRAVQNISALGGAGAAAAIQRSLLRFFDQFGYERLGVSCRLENGVCEMDGIERAPQGYVIVKGGGIPAISVIGYNRSVHWRELLARLKRITQENVKPIVK